MLKHKLAPFAPLALSQSIFAQQAPTNGNQLLQITPSPFPQKAPPAIRLEQGTPPLGTAGADGLKILVKSLRVTGVQVYSEAELIAVTGFTPGSKVSLADLRALALRITDQHGQRRDHRRAGRALRQYQVAQPDKIFPMRKLTVC